MGMEESACEHEYWVMYGRAESLYCLPEPNITLCVNETGIKKKKKRLVSHTACAHFDHKGTGTGPALWAPANLLANGRIFKSHDEGTPALALCDQGLG